MKKETCYMCEMVASSREHVPPKCIFPEIKDIGHPGLRLGLITVPSCEIHNLKKSKDDEFLMVSLAGIIGNNSIGLHHKFTKADRAIKRSSGRLLENVFLKKTIKKIILENNEFIEIIHGTPDQSRLLKCFEHIAYGIYYHHFKERFVGRIQCLLGFVHSKDHTSRNFLKFIKHKSEIELKDVAKHGQNKDVFYYQFTEKDEHGVFSLKLCFYGGVDVYAAFLHESLEMPFNLGLELINSGIKSFIELDGKSYEFN